MSGILLGGLAGQLGSATSRLEQVLFRTPRAIGTIIPDVVVEEAHNDQLVITEHPVEQGASITDHAYKRPAEVSMRCGWSNSSQFNLLSALGFGSENYVREVYDTLLQLQESRVPFDVMTGKRLYNNMLIQSLSLETTAATEYSLIVHVRLKQILIVSLQSAQVQGVSQSPQNQAQPENTQPQQSLGTLQPSGSLLSSSPSFVGRVLGTLGVPVTSP